MNNNLDEFNSRNQEKNECMKASEYARKHRVFLVKSEDYKSLLLINKEKGGMQK